MQQPLPPWQQPPPSLCGAFVCLHDGILLSSPLSLHRSLLIFILPSFRYSFSLAAVAPPPPIPALFPPLPLAFCLAPTFNFLSSHRLLRTLVTSCLPIRKRHLRTKKRKADTDECIPAILCVCLCRCACVGVCPCICVYI